MLAQILNSIAFFFFLFFFFLSNPQSLNEYHIFGKMSERRRLYYFFFKCQFYKEKKDVKLIDEVSGLELGKKREKLLEMGVI